MATTRPARQRVILYTRVSTKEQSERGYSLRDQERRLREHCERKGIEVVAHFQDDHSAKTFDRPGFDRLKRFARLNRNRIDGILFTKWSRFSRDQAGAMNMVKHFLDGLGIEPQAIEQPVDYSVPEQWFLLAIYITEPYVDNQRRSLSVRQGMRQANMEGRWTTTPPIGYQRSYDEDRKFMIVPDPETAPLIREAFEMFATGQYNMNEIRKILSRRAKALDRRFYNSRSRFNLMLRNVVYIGKMRVRAWRDEPEQIVDGQHEALVGEALFYKVQSLFDAPRSGRKAKYRVEMPLRGHLSCSHCKSPMTGSASTGVGGRYWYYHCQQSGHDRVPAERANKDFTKYLSNIKIAPAIVEVFGDVLLDVLMDVRQDRQGEEAALRKKMGALEEKLFGIDVAFVEGRIERDSYERMKERYTENQINIQLRLGDLKLSRVDLAEQVQFGLGLLSSLDVAFIDASPRGRHELLSSIFPRGLIYRDGSYRTSPPSEILYLLSGKNAAVYAKEKTGHSRLLTLDVPSGGPDETRTRDLWRDRPAF